MEESKKHYTQKEIDNRTSDYVCVDCGVTFLSEAQKKEGNATTFHQSDCGLCGKNKAVTHIRHYNYLRKLFQKKIDQSKEIIEKYVLPK